MKRLLAVSASAGSGKTFRLVNRYISLLNLDTPTNIIAITFTNKAANEMKERIIKELNSLGEDETIIQMICNELEINDKELLKRKNNLIKKFLTNDINIQTIDSFINKILRKFSYFAGVRSNFDIGSDDRDVVFNKFLYSLNEIEMQKLIEIAKKEERFFKSLLDLFEDLYERDKELKNIKLKEVKKPNDNEAKEEFYKLKEFILNSNASKSAKNTFDIDFYEIPYKGWFSKDSLNYWHYKKIYEPWFDDVLELLHKFFKEYFDYLEYKFFSNLFYFYEKYKIEKWKFKKEENILDFKDIEHLVYELLRGKINSDFLYFRLDSKINHILIDEFQDTSITQWEIFEPIVSEIASGIGRREFRSFFYVGDVKQSIYRFRGGKKELFFEVAKKYEPFGLEMEELKVNFRSAKNIVNFVNKKFNLNEKPNKDIKGYVEVDEFKKEDVYEKIYEKILFLNENGVDDEDIAILVYKNDDILDIGEFLESKGKKVVTAKKAKVLSQRSAKAIVSLMKYLENNQKQIELLNFLSLIGKKWGEVVDIKIDRPVKMIKEIMDKYDLVDEASLKLLYHSRKYDTLFDFVRDIDNYTEELPLKDFDGITIMTIHKSKGLEFPHVIVVDRLSDRDNNDKSNILFDYEGIKLKQLKLKFPNREFIDNEYKKVQEKEAKLVYEDKKNIEYVAFTRAENSLIILKRNEIKKDGSSYSAFVTELEKMQIGEIIPSEEKTKNEIYKHKVIIKNYGKQEIKVKEEEYKPNDFEAIFYGNAIHFAFECEDIEAVRNHFGDFCDIDEIEQKFKEAKKLLPNGKKEIPFIFEGSVGRIDLITENVIIDYKSVRPHDESKYINQVKDYIKAIEAITGKKFKGRIFYVDLMEFKEV